MRTESQSDGVELLRKKSTRKLAMPLHRNMGVFPSFGGDLSLSEGNTFISRKQELSLRKGVNTRVNTRIKTNRFLDWVSTLSFVSLGCGRAENRPGSCVGIAACCSCRWHWPRGRRRRRGACLAECVGKLGVPSISILPRDPNLFGKPSKTQGKQPVLENNDG